MSTAPPPPRTDGSVRPDSVPITAPPQTSRRRWIGASVAGAVAVVAMLGTVTAVGSVNEREPVLAVARDIPAGQQLTASDLAVAEVADDPALSPVPAGQKEKLVGRYATTGLRKGGLLTAAHTSAVNRLAAGKQMVGIEAKRGQLPAQALREGDTVSVVSTPAEGGSIGSGKGGRRGAGQEPVTGTVTAVGRPDASGAVLVEIAVTAGDGPDLAARAAGGDVAIVLEPGA